MTPRREESDTSGLIDHHPIPAGSIVSTLFGEGRVEEFRLKTTFMLLLFRLERPIFARMQCSAQS